MKCALVPAVWALLMLLPLRAHADENVTVNVTGQTAVNVPGQTADVKISMECCSLLQALSVYTEPATADSVDMQECQRKQHMCVHRPVITRFVSQTRTMLEGTTLSVYNDSTHVHVLQQDLQRRASHVLLLAFLGRALCTGTSCKHDKKIGSDLYSLYLTDSACSIDKTIYSTIVVASIALLVFFVASQVVETEHQHNTNSAPQAPVKTSSQLANPLMLRMRMHERTHFGNGA